MDCRHLIVRWLGLFLVMNFCSGRGTAADPKANLTGSPQQLPFDSIPAELRDRVRAVVDHATLTTRGPVETFSSRVDTYNWLLDHPDIAARLWRLLGAKCAEIQDLTDGRYGWQDGQGSNVHWECVLRTDKQRIWYAEGHVRPGMFLPLSPVRAVVVLNVVEDKDNLDRPVLRHQVDFMLRCDGAALALATRLFGASAPKTAEQYVGQIEMFFSALSWYLDENPKKAAQLFTRLRQQEGRP